MDRCSDTVFMPHIRTALRIALKNRFEPGKELSDEEFENLAVRLFELEMTQNDGGKFLGEFMDRPEIKSRLKIHHPPRYRRALVPLGIFERIREWLCTGRWETESVKYLRVNFGEPGYDEAPFDGTSIYCRDVLNYPC